MIFKAVVLLFSVVLVCGCDNQNESNDQPASVDVGTSIPKALRMISRDSLVAKVAINGLEAISYYGRDNPTGAWQIPVDLIADKNNKVSIKWFSDGLLLLEEKGEIFADSANPVVPTDFDFVTNGDTRFDLDGDCTSNLDELINGSDPFVADSFFPNACNKENGDPEIDPEMLTIPAVTQPYASFEDTDFTRPIRLYSQPLKIRYLDQNKSSKYKIYMVSKRVDELSTSLFFSLEYRPDQGRFLRLQTNRAVSYTASNMAGTECGFNNGVVDCSTPYAWRELHWYVLQLEEVARNTWEASIVDRQTEQAISAGSVVLQENLEWDRVLLGMDYQKPITNRECLLGVAPTLIEFPLGSVNESNRLVRSFLFSPPCMRNGVDFNLHRRNIEGEPVYQLRMGRQ